MLQTLRARISAMPMARTLGLHIDDVAPGATVMLLPVAAPPI